MAAIDGVLGLLKVRVIRGVKLAVHDVHSSDPYVVVEMDGQKLKTSVVKKSINPEWNEDLTLCVLDPAEPIHVHVYDKDTFGFDDKMGNADIDIKPFIEAVQMRLRGLPEGAIIRKIIPSRSNSLADESNIYFHDGKLVQDIVLRLRDVESGEIELQLQWVEVPSSQHRPSSHHPPPHHGHHHA